MPNTVAAFMLQVVVPEVHSRIYRKYVYVDLTYRPYPHD
jgi:hypothetical protein